MLKLEQVYSYYGSIEALRGISLEVPQGSIVTLLGANGAGKTTTMKTITGLIKPKQGRVTYLQQDITGKSPDVLVRQGMALVPEGRAILSGMTVMENLEMGAFHRKDSEVQRDLKQVMERFPILKERASQLGGTLSGGQQQLLAIARALLSRPKLLLLDEPSMGLAPLIVRDIFQLIREINQQGTTILLVEQNARQALKVADYAYVLESGKIVKEGSSQALIKDSGIVEAYLGG